MAISAEQAAIRIVIASALADQVGETGRSIDALFAGSICLNNSKNTHGEPYQECNPQRHDANNDYGRVIREANIKAE